MQEQIYINGHQQPNSGKLNSICNSIYTRCKSEIDKIIALLSYDRQYSIMYNFGNHELCSSAFGQMLALITFHLKLMNTTLYTPLHPI